MRGVRADVFFSAPPPLPRGRHGLTRDEIVAAQRERLMIAFTEVLAEHGYLRITVGQVVARAGVSRAAFYACFADMEACSTAAYDRFIEVLLRRVQDGLAHTTDWVVWIQAVLEAYLGTLQADRVAARAFQIELDAAGAPARERRRRALGLFAQVIDESHRNFRQLDPRLGVVSYEAHLASVYAVRQLACDLLEDPGEPDLLTLVKPMLRWILARDLGAGHVDAALADGPRKAPPAASTAG